MRATTLFRPLTFQSAPPAEARGDVKACRPARATVTVESSGSCFNPLPLPKQGEISSRSQRSCVSIRSHAPLPSRCFNPLPLPKQGEIGVLRRRQGEMRGESRSTIHVSIRSPCRSKGRCIDRPWDRLSEEDRFNPLPLPKQGEIVQEPIARFMQGFFPRCVQHVPIMLFQSAPPAEARGDQAFRPSAPPAEARGAVADGRRCFNPLPLPKQGEMRPPCEAGRVMKPRLTAAVSIRSPCRSKGRSSRKGVLVILVVCFNPLPLPKQGEIEGHMAVNRLPLPSVNAVKFQSAPPAEARGDAAQYNQQNIKRLDARMRDPGSNLLLLPKSWEGR